jgi:intein/homing endonuclease
MQGNCSYAGCFLGGVLVETADGYAPIEALSVGDKVISRLEDGSVETRVVTHTYRQIGCSYYVINHELKVTGAHPFMVDDTWVNAEHLVVGDRLVGRDGKTVLVATIERIDRAVRAYNIEVAGPHTFFVEGVLVHNKLPNPQG